MPTIDEVRDQVTELQDKALDFVKSVQAPVTEYVGKVSEGLAARIPADKPEYLTKGADAVAEQVGFAKKLLATEVEFVNAVLDAAVNPLVKAAGAAKPKAKTVKAA